jgi:hypothetical protein
VSALGLALALLLAAGCARSSPSPSLPLWSSNAAAGRAAESWQFDAPATAAAPPAPSLDGWDIRSHPAPPSPPGVLCREPGTASAVVLTGRPTRDVRLEAQLWTAPGREEALGLVVRWHPDGNYYLARVSSDSNNVRFYRYLDGRATLLASHSVPIAVRRWHTVTLHVRGAEMVAVLNGEPVLRAADEAIPAGGVALWGSNGSRGCFDNVSLEFAERSG